MNIFSQNIKERNISVILVIKNIEIHQLSGLIINLFMKVYPIIAIFASQHTQSRHIKSVHLKESYQCRMCDYQATQKFNLSRHVKNVHQKSENRSCSECNKSIQKRNLKQHMKMYHSGEQTLYHCKVCIFQSKYQEGVSNHVRNVHQKF